MTLDTERGKRISRGMQDLAQGLISSGSEDARTHAWIIHKLAPVVIALDAITPDAIADQAKKLLVSGHNNAKSVVETVDVQRASRLIEIYSTGSQPSIHYSQREEEVLFLSASKIPQKEIARRLSVSMPTVKNHLTNAVKRDLKSS